jgi:hypothetical protein
LGRHQSSLIGYPSGAADPFFDARAVGEASTAPIRDDLATASRT